MPSSGQKSNIMNIAAPAASMAVDNDFQNIPSNVELCMLDEFIENYQPTKMYRQVFIRYV